MLHSLFEMKDIGKADVILGIRIQKNSNGYILTQSHYIEKILKKFGHYDDRPVVTPFDPKVQLKKNKGQSVSQLQYTQVLGSLMYTMNYTRPYLVYSVSRLSQYSHNPGRDHWDALTRVLQYLKHTMAYGLHYTKYPFVLEGFFDANWISNHNEGKSTSGYVFTLGGAIVSWKLSKQAVNTRSTMEAEFVALDKAVEEAEWIRSFLKAEYYGMFLIGITYTRLMYGRIFGNQMAKFSKILMNKDMFTTEMNTMMVGSSRMEVITSKGCSKMYADMACTLGTDSLKDLQPPRHSTSNGPFSGLVICVTGLSKEARKQVMDATERLGGQYSPHLHLQLRLNESLYGVKSIEENYMAKDDLNRIGDRNSCIPVAILENVKQTHLIPRSRLHLLEDQKRRKGIFSGQTFYVDQDVSAEMRNKVVEAVLEEGAMLVNRWLVGHEATHVVCEDSSVQKYLGHSNNLVTPEWVLKTMKEIRSQKLVHLSADLARHVGKVLHNLPCDNDQKVSGIVNVSRDKQKYSITSNHKDNQSIVILAKKGVRNRRVHNMEASQTPIKPLARSILLDSINWNMSEPPSTASVCMDSFSLNDANESMKEPDDCFVNFLRPLSERERSELVYGNHFITVLFPVDRFGEMSHTSRTFFSNTGFTCSLMLDHIYSFYQENMSTSEIELAIHTDSRHADRLRSIYSSKEAAERGFVEVKRIDFLGSQRIFKMLKQVPGNNLKNMYELLTRA
ncbi:BRCT domain-containing protein [Tanacetum coccineum]